MTIEMTTASTQDDCMDAGVRAMHEVITDDCMDAGGRVMQEQLPTTAWMQEVE
ncbi:MAG: hypothetical protein Q7T96_11255 [Methylobacter sp.]|nr:hypothetical protein [Methylobacter sp.]